MVIGLPESFNASEVYEFSMTMKPKTSLELLKTVEDLEDTVSLRLQAMASGGLVEVIPSDLGHEMDGGLTHTSDGNMQRSWNFTWTAPADDSVTVTMRIYGNAVNGGDGSGGDHWNPRDSEHRRNQRKWNQCSTSYDFDDRYPIGYHIIGLGVLWNFLPKRP